MHRDCFACQFEISALNAQLKHYRCGLPYTYRYQKHPNAWSSIQDEKIIIIYLFGVEGNVFYICVVFYDTLGFGERVNNANAGLDQELLWTSIFMQTLDCGESIRYSIQRFLCRAEFVLWWGHIFSQFCQVSLTDQGGGTRKLEQWQQDSQW